MRLRETLFSSRSFILLFGLMVSMSALGAGSRMHLDKNWALVHLQQIATQMQALKSSGSMNVEAADRYAQLDSEYARLSAEMGGDAPVAAGAATNLPASVDGGFPSPPDPPPGFAVTIALFTQPTPAPIPDVNSITSTIVVSGMGGYLWNVDLQTFVTHTFSADLDITLTSPAGTTVTITTDNGTTNDNVFNGTVWTDLVDDNVVDHAYANLMLASPLVPEGAMGAFRGENPNGVWKLKVTDDLAGDTGTLQSWGLHVSSFAHGPLMAGKVAMNAVASPIPDLTTVTSNLIVSGVGTSLFDIDLTTFITHTFSADLDITLTSPAGTTVKITTDNGAGNDNVFYGTVWDDSAATPVTDYVFVNPVPAPRLVPEGAMSHFVGEDPNGTWVLSITDDLTGDTGTLFGWFLDVVTSLPPGDLIFADGFDG
ncbi:MAG: proprotein convertase P-domain-containing protein [Dokdonella sp.]